jgi:hypothetical protein
LLEIRLRESVLHVQLGEIVGQKDRRQYLVIDAS